MRVDESMMRRMGRLADVLSDVRALGRPPVEMRLRRQQLAEFLRAIEPRVFRAPLEARAELRQLLGWDDDALHAFIESPMIVHSSTHVSMNAFPPMLAFPWFCRGVADRHDGGVHLRTQVTHNNLSDNRWKPHVWWRCGAGGRLVRTPLFSKAPRFEHQVLLCQPPPRVELDDLHACDARALGLAGHATNFAYFAMVYRMALERELGLHAPGRTVEVPLDVVNVFTAPRVAQEPWGAALGALGLRHRRVGEDRELHEVRELPGHGPFRPDPLVMTDTVVCPNEVNQALVYRFGVSATIGAEKMTAYVDGMNELIADLMRRVGEAWHRPHFFGVAALPLDEVAPLDGPLGEDVRRQGVRPSLPLLAARYGGELRARLDTLLARPAADFPKLVSRR